MRWRRGEADRVWAPVVGLDLRLRAELARGGGRAGWGWTRLRGMGRGKG